jgi:hypothetical protein
MEILQIGGVRLALVATPSISVAVVQTSAKDGHTHFKDVSVVPPPMAMLSESASPLGKLLVRMRRDLVAQVATHL